MGDGVSPRRVRVEGDLFHGRIPDGAVYVGRATPGIKASRYGNPWTVRDRGRAEAVRYFAEYLAARRERRDPFWYNLALEQRPYPFDAMPYPSDEEIRAELTGRDLACWCPLPAPGEPDLCHAATLLALASEDVPGLLPGMPRAIGTGRG